MLLSLRRMKFSYNGRRRCYNAVDEKYKSLVSNNALTYDEHQYRIVKTMTKVQSNIVNFANSSIDDSSLPQESPRGLYLYGSVGSGKTLLMDMCFDSTDLKNKRRVHFHKFMLEVHTLIYQHKQYLLKTFGRDKNLNLSDDRDPILHAARVISKDAQLLCFDEFQITDIADAIIMTKLFGEIWKQGTIVIATSNRPPSDLYLDALEHRLLVRQLQSLKDYRKENSTRVDNAFFTPLNEQSTRSLYSLFLSSDKGCSVGSAPVPVELPVMMGRSLLVSARSLNSKSCWISFEDMCGTYKGAADYAALASNMDVIFMHGIPKLSVLEHDKARRFITLIDEVYDAGKVLKWTSECDPENIFQILTPQDMKGCEVGSIFGTDHSWADKDVVQGERGGPISDINNAATNKTFQYEKAPFDGMTISKRFQIEPKPSDDEPSDDLAESVVPAQDTELKMLEGELASIQELSFAFRRAASRLVEISSVEYGRRR